MPEIVVYAAEGRSHEQKQELMQKIASAVKETFGIPLNKVVWRRRPKTSCAVAFSAASVKRFKAARLPT
ncbi:tautomerase family protein [Comamonas testosteroni]|uniref:4-oxalocrotonate tautomerase n=1 Tax=Comamonas testosteroni TaxID=285 RepID=A0A096FMJ2_COMTE|nr:tautomerase family protein [Comamonas testosteroni]KGH31109.1 4-oxalocrotonate tautomerase [Comamonas testosteroni]